MFPPSSPLLFLFHLLWGFGALIHPWRPRGTQPPTHQSTRPATITDQRRDVTMRLRIAFRYDNRSAVTDAPPVHALLQQLQPCRCAEAPCKHPAGEEGCSPRARACECVFSPTQTSVGLSGHYGTPNGKFNSKVYEALQDNLWKLFYESPFTPG